MRVSETGDAPAPPDGAGEPTGRVGLWVVASPLAGSVGTCIDVPERGTVVLGRLAEGHAVGRADRWMSRRHFSVRASGGAGGAELELRAEASKHGTFVNRASVETCGLRDGDVIRAGATVLLVARGEVPAAGADLGLVGWSREVGGVRSAIRRWGPGSHAVHIRGETGVGKEVVAAAVHEVSGRRGAFVPVNAASIPRELAEAQLFGTRRGAFTGAHRDEIGFFGEAVDGSLFLDEVGELAAELQAKLLRALAAPGGVEVQRVGATKPELLDVRVITATHRDLIADVEAGNFRQDLYFRIATLRIDIPPLRARRLDIVPLFLHFLDECGARPLEALLRDGGEAAWHIADLVEVLLSYPWPGNVRELRSEALKTADVLAGRTAEGGDGGAVPPLAELLPPHIVASANRVQCSPRADVSPKPAALEVHRDAADDVAIAAEKERLQRLLEDPDGLAAAIVAETGGQIRTFARQEAARTGGNLETLRRRIYGVLGPERVARLRSHAGRRQGQQK